MTFRVFFGLVLGVAGLCACDPQVMADKVVARTAESVIEPVAGPAATRCIVDNATPEELRDLAVDVGVEAGTSTIANIRAIAGRPATQACLVAAGQSTVLPS